MLLKGSVDTENLCLDMVSLDEEEDKQPDKRKDKAQRAHTRRNPKRHIPLVSLLLLRKVVAVHCFIWPLGLRL